MNDDKKLMLRQVKSAKEVYIMFTTGHELSDGFYMKAIKRDLLKLIENYSEEFRLDRFKLYEDDNVLYIN